MNPAPEPNPIFAQKTDAELLYLTQHAYRYPVPVVQAAVRELQRRELIPAELPAAHAPARPPETEATWSQLLGGIARGLFWPSADYFVTPILVNLNLLLFGLMALGGVHVLNPSGRELISWGSNFSPLTLHGQPWRLLSNTFLHAGLAHLLLNMGALLLLGFLIEPLIGRVRLLSAYLLSGIGGSLLSLWWHSQGLNSVGASGAIFGLYGLLLMLLLTRAVDVPRSDRRHLLWFVLYFVLSNLLAGLEGNTDNAAHVGGLIVGTLSGLVMARLGLRKTGPAKENSKP
ncbi:rhomboid family intramembrane serine protease [Hymenobacter sp. BT175]|uniref:rhomboid family intramembrane serine protease n=1 Tax=Hymenobacter translucens TaxID=2886507 RepID=UPI001D0E3061|nr:rhomboid family intramembrane serine protease [Hymenobacter translucens]MCC2547157.1 rhomboid family intramembrane serine protease [Hymenobacter translucens]